MHLVLRVQTDDALKLTTTTTSEQLREALRTAGITVGDINSAVADDVPGRGGAAGQGRAVPAIADEVARPTTTATRARTAPTPSR